MERVVLAYPYIRIPTYVRTYIRRSTVRQSQLDVVVITHFLSLLLRLPTHYIGLICIEILIASAFFIRYIDVSVAERMHTFRRFVYPHLFRNNT